MKERRLVFNGIVDKNLNPFSISSWRREGKPEGYGRMMTKRRIQDFKKILDKGGKINDIKEPNSEKYPAFQAIRWSYAIIEGDKVVPTKKWYDIENRSESKNEIQRSYIKRKTVKKRMSRKQFIESIGGICKSWTWSWSFVNHEKKIVIFGAWDINTTANKSLILDSKWEFSDSGRKNPGFSEACEYIDLIEKQDYKLQTFPIIYSNEKKNENGIGPATIKEIIPELKDRQLLKIGTCWYASNESAAQILPEEVTTPSLFNEGALKQITINIYERNNKARTACINHYGTSCTVCGFSFEKHYGEIGIGYIHVHHILPLSEIKAEYKIDPINDLRPICPNCHCMIHSAQPSLSIDQLKLYLSQVNRNRDI
jgi:5-methylcytosine-specific restriction protein A